MGTSENSISFFGAGGHNHDGSGSTLIDVRSYSIFDFPLGYRGSQARINLQQANQTAMEEWVIRIVNSKVLQPSGLSLKPDSLNGKSISAGTIEGTQIKAETITANEIKTKTITGAELADDSVGSDQVDDVMSIINIQSDFVATNAILYSTDYDGTTPGTGTAGWRLWANGDAEFNDIFVRGHIEADTGYIGSDFTIGANATIEENAEISNNCSILNNLTIGNNVRINGAVGDGSVSVLKIRADNQPNSNTSNPGRQPLTVVSYLNNIAFRVLYNGECYYGTSMQQDSDMRLKKNIKKTTIGLNFIKELNPVEYNWNKEEIKNQKLYYGFIAQEVIEVSKKFNNAFEGWSYRDDSDAESYLSLDYVQFIAPMVKAIQELSERNEQLEARLQALEGV